MFPGFMRFFKLVEYLAKCEFPAFFPALSISISMYISILLMPFGKLAVEAGGKDDICLVLKGKKRFVYY